MGLAERAARFARALSVAALLLLVAAFSLTRDTDNDLGWHLATGDLIRRTGSVPRLDPFSYTAAGRPYIEIHWLFQVALSLLHEAGGLAVLMTLREVLIVGLFAALFARCREAARSGSAAAGGPAGFGDAAATNGAVAALVLTAIACQERFLLRPEIVSWVLMTLVLAALDRASRDGPALPAARRRLLLWVGVPLVHLVWVNVQGLFMIGPALVSMALVAAGIEAAMGRDRTGPVREIALGLGLSVAACLVNPRGARVLLLPFRQFFTQIGGAGLVGKVIAEFQPPLSGFVVRPPIVAFVLLAALTIAALALDARRARLFDVLVAAATLYAALRARRNVPIFVLAAAPILLRHAAGAAAAWRGRRTAPAGPVGAARVAVPAASAAAALLLTFAVVTDRYFQRWPTELWWGPGTIPYYFPEEGARFIAAAGIPGQVFHPFDTGGYLIHAWEGRRPVFIDGRNDPYLEGVLQEYIEDIADPAAFEATARRYGISAVLWTPTRALEGRLLLEYLARGHGWVLVHLDPGAAVYLRRETARAIGLGPVPLARDPAAVCDALRRALGARPYRGPPIREMALAEFFSVSGDAGSAASFWRAALERLPRQASLWSDLGTDLAAAGRTEQARDAHERALALDPSLLHSVAGLGAILADRGEDPARAERLLRTAYDEGFRDPRVLAGLARLRELAGQPAEAVRYLQEALNAAPQDVPLLLAVVAFYERQGEPEAALQVAGLASAADPEEPEVARVHSALLLESGKTDEALAVERSAAAAALARLASGDGWVGPDGAGRTASLFASRTEDARWLGEAAALEERSGDRRRAASYRRAIESARLAPTGPASR
jgi:Flp pilus assembly protein TadD